jgi:hypothetical protein
VSITTLHITMRWPLRPILVRNFKCVLISTFEHISSSSHYKPMSPQQLSRVIRHLSYVTRKSTNLPQQYICILLSPTHDDCLRRGPHRASPGRIRCRNRWEWPNCDRTVGAQNGPVRSVSDLVAKRFLPEPLSCLPIVLLS